LLHIAYEVVSQLDNAEDFRHLSLEELSLQDFLVQQIHSLQPVVEAQEDFASPLAQDSVVSAQALWPSQPHIASFGHLSGASPHVDRQVDVDWCGPSSGSKEVMLSPPWHGPKPPWMLCPCLLSLSSLLSVATLVVYTLTPS
jgi:hypothetical protein